MKVSKFLMGFLSLAFLATSCSKNDAKQDDLSPYDGDLGSMVVKLPSNVKTRAGETFEGSDTEKTIKETKILLLTKDNRKFSYETLTLERDNTAKVEKVPVDGGKLVIITNPTAAVDAAIDAANDLAAINNAVANIEGASSLHNTEGNIVMTSPVVTYTPANVNVGDEATATPVEVKVDKALAKVFFVVKEEAYTFNDASYGTEFAFKADNNSNVAGNVKFSIQVLNKKFSIIKGSEAVAGYPKDANYENIAAADRGNHFTNAGFEGGSLAIIGADGNAGWANGATSDLYNKGVYVPENTMKTATSLQTTYLAAFLPVGPKQVIKGGAKVDLDATKGYVRVRIGETKYLVEGEYFWNAVNGGDLKLGTDDAVNAKAKELVESFAAYNGGAYKETAKGKAFTYKLHDAADADKIDASFSNFPGSKSFYHTYIQHNDAAEGEGKYGVVRNFIYGLKLEKLTRTGDAYGPVLDSNDTPEEQGDEENDPTNPNNGGDPENPAPGEGDHDKDDGHPGDPTSPTDEETEVDTKTGNMTIEVSINPWGTSTQTINW